jgi:DNA polymerase phi
MFTIGSKASSHSHKSSQQSSAEDSHAPIDIFVDVIIGFLERSTAFMRAVGIQVFSLLSGAIQESTIELLLTVRPISWPLTYTDFRFFFSISATRET